MTDADSETGLGTQSEHDDIDASQKRGIFRLRVFTLLLASGWTACILFSLWYNIEQVEKHALDSARIQARTLLGKDIDSLYNGIFTQAAQEAAPTAGRPADSAETLRQLDDMLARLNPAYMAIIMHEMGNRNRSAMGHITSRTPFNDKNAPDAWESEALARLEKNHADEVSDRVRTDGVDSIRLMRGLTTAESCLACHTSQGYAVGELCGGISTAVPVGPYLEAAEAAEKTIFMSLVLLWCAGIVGIGVCLHHISGDMQVRYKAESALAALASNLELRVAERTEELRIRKTEAEEANRVKSSFLSRMSHEMRTPMNAIIGMTGIAKSTPSAEKKEDCLNRIQDAAKHLLGVINDILDMSKIETGNFELFFDEFSFSEMIDRAIVLFAFKISEKRQNITVGLDEKIPQQIISDEQRLTQIFTNLLSNAVKFTPEQGTISVNAALEAETDNICLIRIAVSDTGIGISPEVQRKLFRPFEQADAGSSRRFGGTGLGLAVSKHIVELMHGDIRVESEIGKGSTFSFSFTVERAPAPESAGGRTGQDAGAVEPEDSAAPGADAGTERSGDGEPSVPDRVRGCRLLLAEDVEINREIMLAVMEPAEAAVTCAENGLEAVKLFSDNPGAFDLILMDINMPEMDGYEATRRIRALGLPEAATIPIVAMTANTFREDVESCLEAGMNDHIAKPINTEELFEKLQKHLPGNTPPAA
ncbi:MAG: response regulator [Desulfovibrio sp.]|nr:response regulator [Desulfovibrio sp.]